MKPVDAGKGMGTFKSLCTLFKQQLQKPTHPEKLKSYMDLGLSGFLLHNSIDTSKYKCNFWKFSEGSSKRERRYNLIQYVHTGLVACSLALLFAKMKILLDYIPKEWYNR